MPVRMTQPRPRLARNTETQSSTRGQDRKDIPRSKADSKSTTATEKAGSAWSKFTGSFSSSSAWYGAAGAAALAPAMLMAPGADAVVANTNGTVRDGVVDTDTGTPVSVAADTLGTTENQETNEKPVFPPPGTFAERAWNRVDRNRNGSINGTEIKNYLSRVGVSGGFLGSVHNQAVSAAMKEADLNGDSKISKKEISGLIANIDVGDVLDENGRVKPELADRAFAKIDTNSSNAISASELEKHINKTLPEETWFKSTVASAARKIGMDMLDTNRDKVISKAEFDQTVQDLQKVKASVSSD